MLRVLHYLFLHRSWPGQAPRELYENLERPEGLSRSALSLVESTLARGCVQWLVRAGGWRHAEHLQGDEPRQGRLWERHPLAELHLKFSKNTLNLLLWLTCRNVGDVRSSWPKAAIAKLTLADQLFRYVVFGALRHHDRSLLTHKARTCFTRDALIRLAFPGDFADYEPAGQDTLDFTFWTAGAGTWILEALQCELAERWLQMEQKKRKQNFWEKMKKKGESQERVLVQLLEALEQSKRRDLARFLFMVLHELLQPGRTLHWWLGNLVDTGPRMGDRIATARGALAVVRQMERLQRWYDEARATPFYEESYQVSQFYLREWERWQGGQLAARAQELLRQGEPFSATTEKKS